MTNFKLEQEAGDDLRNACPAFFSHTSVPVFDIARLIATSPITVFQSTVALSPIASASFVFSSPLSYIFAQVERFPEGFLNGVPEGVPEILTQ